VEEGLDVVGRRQVRLDELAGVLENEKDDTKMMEPLGTKTEKSKRSVVERRE
jgi:hypothetical protein